LAIIWNYITMHGHTNNESVASLLTA